MSDKTERQGAQAQTTFSRKIGAQAARKRKAQRNTTPGVWFGLGMMGLIGWSVVVPTLLGAALGIWLDNRYPGSHSWTLMLLLIGLIIGCINAWQWVTREEAEMSAEQTAQEEQEKQDDHDE